jgi:hypothetical protein
VMRPSSRLAAPLADAHDLRGFPLLASFSLREVENKEMLVSKISLPMPDFPVARLPNEMNDHFLCEG